MHAIVRSIFDLHHSSSERIAKAASPCDVIAMPFCNHPLEEDKRHVLKGSTENSQEGGFHGMKSSFEELQEGGFQNHFSNEGAIPIHTKCKPLLTPPSNGIPPSFRSYALSELPEPEPTTWILEGYIGKGLKTELVGVWKGCKTTCGGIHTKACPQATTEVGNRL